MLDLQKIKARADAATPGPWAVHHILRGPDATFVTHAQRDVVALVAEMERLLAENESLRKELSDTEEELDDLYRTNPFYKGKPDA